MSIYWPHWNQEEAGRSLSQVRSTAVPSRPGYPFFEVPPLDILVQVQPHAGERFANAVRIDVSDEPESDDDIALLTRRLLRWMRVLTGQWWIGHAHRGEEGLIRARYLIDAKGRLSSRGCVSGPRIEPRVGIERPLERTLFLLACSAAVEGREPPPHQESILDALYFSVHQDDQRRALLEACIACDLAVLHEAIRAARQQGRPEALVRHTLSDRDLLGNLRKHIPELFGRHADLSVHQSEDFELIRRLWSARGAIASRAAT